MTHPTLIGLRIAGGRVGTAGSAWKRIGRRSHASPAQPGRSASVGARRPAPGHPVRQARSNRRAIRSPGRPKRATTRILVGAQPIRRVSRAKLERQHRDIQVLGAALGVWVLVMLVITSSA